MKKVFFFILICSFSIKSFSQIQFSLTGGTIIEMVDDLPFDGYGYYAGITTIFPLSKSWSFTPEIRFTNIEHYENNYSQKIHYFEMPLSFEHKTKLKKNKYFKFNVGGFWNISIAGSSMSYYENSNSTYRNEENLLGVGVLCGAGFEINKFYVGVEPNFRYYDVSGAGLSLNTKIAYRF